MELRVASGLATLANYGPNVWLRPAPTFLFGRSTQMRDLYLFHSLFRARKSNTCHEIMSEIPEQTPGELNGVIHSTITRTTMYSAYPLYIRMQTTTLSTTPSRPKLGRVAPHISRDTLPSAVRKCVPASRRLFLRVPISLVPK